MIPLQVRMRGWMRYRDEEVADFSGGNLVSICGENGAGKSSIFDAITYALFGKHRLGQQATEELISQDEDAAWVEFDFEMDGVRWRVHRGRSRGTTTRTGTTSPGATTHALYRFDDASDTWIQVPNTDSPINLQKVLDGILRMSEPAFTSSFLLQQGAATQFLDARAADRFKIISSLIGLEAYERLAKQAGDSARRERERVEDIAKSLAGLGDVSTEAVSAQQEAWRRAQSEGTAAQEALVKAQSRAIDAARFADRSSEIEKLSLQIREADLLIARKARIEEDARTYEGFAASLETLTRLQQELEAAKYLREEADAARANALAIDIEALNAALDESRHTVIEAEATAEAAAAVLAAAVIDERVAHDCLLLAEAVIAARARLKDKLDDAMKLVAQLAGLEDAKAQAASLALLARTLQPLGAYELSLTRLASLEQAGPVAALDLAVARRESQLANVAAAEADRVKREEAWHLARDDQSVAGARLADVMEQLQQREEAVGETVCSRCGQPVSEEHRQAEISELKAQVEAAREMAQGCLDREGEAMKARTDAGAVVVRLQDEGDALRRRIDGLQHDVKTLEETRAETARCLQALKAAAPVELRKLVAKRPAAEVSAVLLSLADVPSRESAAANHYQALLGVEGQFAAVQREAQAAEIGVRAAEERAGSGLEQVDGAAAAHQEAKVCLDRAKQDQEATASLLASKRAFCMTAAETLETAKQERAQMESLASQKDAEAQGRMNTAAAHSERLPESMRSQALQDAASMIVDLDAAKERLAQASALLTHLRLAEQNQAGWDGERRSKETEIGEIPEAHRVGVEEAQAGLRLAERANLEAMESVQEAASELARLEERLERREELEAQSETATRRQRLFNKLNRLLGKSGLQGALVTGALDSIKNHANAFLEHLTGGSLVLELHKGTGADELDLRAVDTTCMREARSVQALSGSQKFRCAVAIAMGIGQYAGGRMRSIVIDEGFGSLDEIGQEQMVDELKNLSDNMDKVIVVSHLDLFRDRDHFPYQLHVEKAGTASHLRVVA